MFGVGESEIFAVIASTRVESIYLCIPATPDNVRPGTNDQNTNTSMRYEKFSKNVRYARERVGFKLVSHVVHRLLSEHGRKRKFYFFFFTLSLNTIDVSETRNSRTAPAINVHV